MTDRTTATTRGAASARTTASARGAASARKQSGWDVRYEADALPDATTPVWTKAGDAPTIEISPAGYLHIETTDEIGVSYTLEDSNLILATGATCEFKLKVLAGHTISPAFSLEIKTADGGISWDISTDGITDADSREQSYSFDTTDDYHTFRTTLTAEGAKVYVDGILRMTWEINPEGYTPQIIFTINASDNTVCEWLLDYLYYRTDGAYEPI